MKKAVLLITALVITIGLSAQRGRVSSALSFIERGELDRAKEALDDALEHRRTEDWPRTYYALGRLAQAVADSEDRRYRNLLGSNPLVQAYEAYEKAMELDDRNTIRNSLIVNETYAILGNQFINHALARWEAQDFEGALEGFQKYIKIGTSETFTHAEPDTVFYFNAGLAALYAGLYETAIEYFEYCAELGYEGVTTFANIYQAYLGLEDLEMAEKTLKRGIDAFPDDEGTLDLLLALIQFYIDTGQPESAHEYIDIALPSDPNNAALYLARGTIFMGVDEYDDAIPDLQRSIELDDSNWAAHYNLGIAYYNLAIEATQRAAAADDFDEADVHLREAQEFRVRSKEPLERAHEINPADMDVMRTLRSIYGMLYGANDERYIELTKKIEGGL